MCYDDLHVCIVMAFSDVAGLFISMIKDILEVQITENYVSFDPNTGSPK